MTVSNTTGLTSGDEILVIQMQGASVSQSNTSAYGSVSNYNGAGRYELARVCEINGNEVVFDSILVNSGAYAVIGNIQLVSIPEYGNAIVTTTLSASPWDGTTGGVLILRATGSLTLNAAIDLDGVGFRGGGYQNASGNCNGFFAPSNYAYTTFQDGGKKGEGIVAYSSLTDTYGKGPAANGGGGGNNHNAGGGGGGHAGAGGLGGENETSGFGRCKGPHPGVGGRTVATNGRIFMGGGSGSGHGNNNLGSGGSPGGGIAIIMAGNLIAGTSNLITADGLDGVSGLSDGVGGGGAGGTIQLAVGSFTGNLQLGIQGGNGGSVNNEGLNFCMGPGGGGAGGLVISSSTSILPGTVTSLTAGGNAGTSTNVGSSCNATNTNHGATNGIGGSVNISGSISKATTDYLCEPLAVVWGDVWAEVQREDVLINALVLFEHEGNRYVLEKSYDGQLFESLPINYMLLSSNEPAHYRWEDNQVQGGTWYYRVKQADALGRFYYSPTIQVEIPFSFTLKAFPNPLPSAENLHISGSVPHRGDLNLQVINTLGQVLTQQNLPFSNELSFNLQWKLPNLPPGSYYLRAQFEGQLWHQVLVIQ